MKMLVAPDHGFMVPSPSAALSSSRSEVVPTATIRPPRARTACCDWMRTASATEIARLAMAHPIVRLLPSFSWRELRHHPWRSAAAVLPAVTEASIRDGLWDVEARRLDEDFQIGLLLPLSDEFVKLLRAQMGIESIL